MLNVSEDDLICDFAETYHVLNWKELPPTTAAALACGLHEDSRIKRRLSGQKISLDQMLMAMMVDELNLLLWTKTKDGHKNRNKPESLLRKLIGLDKKQKDELMSFTTPEQFEAWRRKKQEEYRNV